MHKPLVVLFGSLMFLLAVGSLPGTVATEAPQPVGQDEGWVLVFHDDFEEGELDTGKWSTCYWWGRHGCTNSDNNEEQWYLPDNVFIRDGMLVLQAREQTVTGSDGNTYEYTSGIVTTGSGPRRRNSNHRFTFQYGYAEIKAKIPPGRGLWSAFWMLPSDNGYNPEFDVMEVLGHDPRTFYTTVHWYYGGNDHHEYSLAHRSLDPSQEWYVFGFEWQPDALLWYLDGERVAAFTGMEHIEAQEMYLLLNLAVGGDWAGSPDDQTAFPAEFQIEYVSVWQR